MDPPGMPFRLLRPSFDHIDHWFSSWGASFDGSPRLPCDYFTTIGRR